MLSSRRFCQALLFATACVFALFAVGCGQPKGDGSVSASGQVESEEQEAEKAPAPQTVVGQPEREESDLLPAYSYSLVGSHQVDGRQGIAWYDGKYYVSGSTTLSVYDKDWNRLALNDSPFEEYEVQVNHIGDIDVYEGEIYAGAENFLDGEASDIQIAVYDAETLKLTRTYLFDVRSGQNECSGIAVDPDSRSIWMTAWPCDEPGRFLYRYSLDTGEYLGRVHLQPGPQWLQGVAYLDGWLYLTADDGTADLGEPDHVWRTKVDVDKTAWPVVLERTLDDVTMQGEIEGLSFDRENDQLLVSYNRGSQIVLGMVKGFYEGYDEEVHEIFVYDMEPTDNSRG